MALPKSTNYWRMCRIGPTNSSRFALNRSWLFCIMSLSSMLSSSLHIIPSQSHITLFILCQILISTILVIKLYFGKSIKLLNKQTLFTYLKKPTIIILQQKLVKKYEKLAKNVENKIWTMERGAQHRFAEGKIQHMEISWCSD